MVSIGLIPAAVIIIYLLSSIKILREYERGVTFRLGRVLPQPKGPGPAWTRPRSPSPSPLTSERGPPRKWALLSGGRISPYARMVLNKATTRGFARAHLLHTIPTDLAVGAIERGGR